MNTQTKNLILAPFNLLYQLAPETELKLMFRLKQKYPLNLKDPRTYNEKLQWIKLYDKHPDMPRCCDKFTVRQFVEERGCGQLLNELYWEGTDPEAIPYDSLPEQFVIKVTHGSTYNIIVKDKKQLNIPETSKKLRAWLKSRFIACYGEWFYGKVPPRIIVEKYLEDPDLGELLDYKIFCFNGKARLVDVHSGRFGQHKRNIYDRDWNFLDTVHFKYPHGPVMEKPAQLEAMLSYAETLAAPFTHARVDFFLVGGQIIFGEVTFTNGAGFDPITPREFDLEMGSWLQLPKR